MKKEKVLILGNDNRSFLTVIRSLGRRGLEVHIAWCDPEVAALHSRYVTKIHEITGYDPVNNDWKEDFVTILKKEKFSLVIPCNDQSIIPLQCHRQELEGLSQIYLLDDDVFETTYNKQAMFEMAGNLGIPVPDGALITAQDDLDPIILKFGFPLVLKPFSSFSLNNLTKRQEIRKAFSLGELRSLLSFMTRNGPLLVQKNFAGIGAGIELLADRGEILTVFQHLRVHEPVHGGGGPYRKSCELDPELYQAAEKLIAALRYTGVAMLEFKINPETGKWVFIEINARFWGSLPLAVASGMDFPWYLYELIVHGRRDFNTHYKKGLYCRNLVMDIEWFRNNLREDRSDPYLHTLPVRKVALEFLNILTFRERSDTFVWDDPRPGIVDLFSWVQDKWKAFKGKVFILLHSLRIVKAHHRRKAIRRLCRNPKILFVCTGNICRSPYASSLAWAELGSSFLVSSQGLLAVPGRNCPPLAVKTANQAGIDLAGHSAAPLSQEEIDRTGAVFVFDLGNYEGMIGSFKNIKTKLFYLGAFLPQGSVVIADPDGGDAETFAQTYQTIAQAVANLKKGLEIKCGRLMVNRSSLL
jgi:protein-tyrosine-phosphatase/predicted ATP-grasp superfamily ATP-dependent carboligase